MLMLATLTLALLTAVTNPEEDPEEDFLWADRLCKDGLSNSSLSRELPFKSQLTVFRLPVARL